MRYIYDLNDISCEDNICRTVKQEVINILESSEDKIIDIEGLFADARKNIIDNIIENYLNGVYPENSSFDSETTCELDKILRTYTGQIKRINRNKEKCDNIINSGEYTSGSIKEARSILAEVYEVERQVKHSFGFWKHILSNDLAKNSSIESMVFSKLDNGKYGVAEWIKPYLDKINFYTLSISDINIENYDFTGTMGVNISSKDIKDNTLANTILNGATIKCYHNGKLYPIDPTKVDINGADFTGSYGAIVDLENISEIPENCNLTDAIIMVNSKADIKKFNLDEYKKNIYLKQQSIVCNDKIIDYDINDYLNYTGSIDDNETGYINETFEIDGASKEETRVESNKMISYLIALEFANLIDFDNLYDYFAIFKKTNEYMEEHPEFVEETTTSVSNNDEKTTFNAIKDSLSTLYQTVGNPFSDGIKYTIGDNKLKLFTRHGILTVDFLRLGISEKDLDLIFKGKKSLNLTKSTNKIITKFYNALYNCVVEPEDEEEATQNGIISFSNLFSNYHNVERFEECFINTLENLIYKNLESNNKGYSYEVKKIKTRRN